MASGWSSTKPKTRSNSLKMEDIWAMFDLSDGEYHQGRPVGPIYSFEQHWLDIITEKGKKVSIPKLCLDYDPETEGYRKKRRCPYCKGGINASRTYVQNFIDRDEQENKPRKAKEPTRDEKKMRTILDYKAYWKDPKSKSWTPMRVVRVPNTLAQKLQGLGSLNHHKIKGKKKTFELNHPRYGMDINLKYDSEAAGPAKYDAQKEEKTALSEEELEYLLHDLTLYKPDSLEQAKTEWENLKSKLDNDTEDEDDEDDDDDDDNRSSKKKSKKSSKKSKSKRRDDDDDDDNDEDLEDFDDIEDIDELLGRGKKKKKSKKKRR